MDSNRAKQIMASKDRIEVFYNGSPVWIEGIRENEVAEVTPLTGDKQRKEVPLYMLFEKELDINQ